MKPTPYSGLKAARRDRLPALTCGAKYTSMFTCKRTQLDALTSHSAFCVFIKTSPVHSEETHLSVS